MGRLGRVAFAVAVLAFGAFSASAHAQLPELPEPVNLPWERQLPAQPGRTDVQPHAVPGCRDGSLRCVARVEAKLRRQWRHLDAACDHRVIASLAYLRITELLHRDLARKRPRFFRHKKWMAYVITDFSNSYFDAFTRYERGKRVPESWKSFYDTARSGDANALQDLLLFSNAHAQHDLPLTYASMGLRTPSGASRKRDHDGVNEINVRAIPKIKAEIERRYDPSVRDVPGPLDEMARAGAHQVVAGDGLAQRGTTDRRARQGRPRPGRGPDRDVLGRVGQADRIKPAGSPAPARRDWPTAGRRRSARSASAPACCP